MAFEINQTPENWQYAGEIMYNKGVVMVSYNGIMGALGGIIFGPASLGSIAKGILAGLGSYGLHHYPTELLLMRNEIWKM